MAFILLAASPSLAGTTSWNNGHAAGSCGEFIATDANGYIYVDDPNSGTVEKYSGTGGFLGTIGPRAGHFAGLSGSGDGGIYLAYQAFPGWNIVKFDRAGNNVNTIVLPMGRGDGQAGSILAIGTDGNGNIYVLDHQGDAPGAANRVEKLSPGGSYVAQWGSTGDGNGQFDFIGSQGHLAVAFDGTVYVADADNRIQRFDSHGTFLAAWGSTGSGPGQFERVAGLAVDATGHVYAGDSGPSGRTGGLALQQFDSTGRLLSTANYPRASQIGAVVTYGDRLVYGYGCTTIYAFELTEPDASISISPSGAHAGQAVTATATASVPFGSITDYSFDFGDGRSTSTSASPSATHTYMAAGTYQITARIRSSRGGTATTSTSILVRPVAKLTALSVSPRVFRAAASGKSITTSPKAGTKVRYTLSVAGTVRFTIQRAMDGRQVGGRCMAPTRRNARARHCVQYVPMRGSFTVTARAGSNSLRFSGRLNGRKLAPGSYRLTAAPSTGPLTGVARTSRFTIIS